MEEFESNTRRCEAASLWENGSRDEEGNLNAREILLLLRARNFDVGIQRFPGLKYFNGRFTLGPRINSKYLSIYVIVFALADIIHTEILVMWPLYRVLFLFLYHNFWIYVFAWQAQDIRYFQK